jgi:PAS domain S-box-containing protein
VLAAALDPIVTIDAHGVIQSASDSVQRVFGWTPNELTGRNISILMPEPHHSAHDGYLARYRRTGRTNILGRTREFEGVRKGGERFPIEISVARVDTGDGGLPLFVGILRDVSERKRMERELRLVQDLAISISGASSLSGALIETIRQIALATSWDHGEVWTAATEGTGLARASSWARPGSGLEEFAQSVGATALPHGSGLPGQAWTSGRPVWTSDIALLSVAEFPRRQEARAAGIRAAAAIPILSDNSPIAVLVFFVRETRREDLHLLELVRAAVAPLGTVIQRRRAEEELGEYRRRLEEKVEERTRELQASQDKLRLADRLASIGTLAAGLGHDMNNVLLPVRAHLNALRAGGGEEALSPIARQHVDAVHKSIAYLQQLADGLHFLATDPEGGERDQGSLDLAEWWAHAGPLISKAVPKHVRVTAAIPAGLPAIRIGAPGLTQAILNLVVNAGEAIPPPSERKRRQGLVRVWAAVDETSAAGPRLTLGVTDNGVGMNEEVKRRAFEMFFTTKTRGLGTGLGLALVRRVADGAGGTVEIATAPGKGTTVTISFPVASSQAATPSRNGETRMAVPRPSDRAGSRARAAAESRAPVHAASIDEGRAGVRVLCVDDHAVLVEGLKAQFAITGKIRVIGRLPSAENLLEEVARLRPDVVLLDIEMPGPDAFEAADRLLHRYPSLRFVFLSAHIRDGYLAAAHQSGAWGYFAKGDELEDIVAGVLEVARSPSRSFVTGPKVRQRCGAPAGGSAGAAAGGRPPAGSRPGTPLDSLTAREIEVLRLIGKGLSRHEIAAELSRSAKTIDGHQERMMKKLGIDSRADLMRFAIREGLAEP